MACIKPSRYPKHVTRKPEKMALAHAHALNQINATTETGEKKTETKSERDRNEKKIVEESD